jgi:hypothetical protein
MMIETGTNYGIPCHCIPLHSIAFHCIPLHFTLSHCITYSLDTGKRNLKAPAAPYHGNCTSSMALRGRAPLAVPQRTARVERGPTSVEQQSLHTQAAAPPICCAAAAHPLGLLQAPSFETPPSESVDRHARKGEGEERERWGEPDANEKRGTSYRVRVKLVNFWIAQA